ncbi:HEAT repeat domain-containing protein [Chloroflexota bacterium]
MPSAIKKLVTGLGKKNNPLLNTELVELSNLTPDEVEDFIGSWQAIKSERRQQILERLVELAEDNLVLNFDAVFRHCLSDDYDKVRCKAIEGLWENEEAVLIEPLIEILEQDESETVRASAAIALGKYAVLAELGKLREEYVSRVHEALLSAIINKKNSPEVNRRALEAVAPVSLPEVQEAIGEAYKSALPGFKTSAIYAMGKSCNNVWTPILVRELSNADAEVRYEAAGACGEIEEEELVPYLINAVDDSDVDVRMAAIQALGKIGNSQAKECLRQCLESDNDAIRKMAEQVLGDIDTGEDPLDFQI